VKLMIMTIELSRVSAPHAITNPLMNCAYAER
jgi:hypothetical protein